MLPALRIVHAALTGELLVNARNEVMGIFFSLAQTHGVILPSIGVAGKDASRSKNIFLQVKPGARVGPKFSRAWLMHRRGVVISLWNYRF